MTNTGRNDPCPCGSGKKYKRCCLRADEAKHRAPSADDRQLALALLRRFADEYLDDEVEYAMDEFWQDIPLDWELDRYQDMTSDDVFWNWFFYDRRLDGGETPAEVMLDPSAPMAGGLRRYMKEMSRSFMQLWEVVDAIPGRSIEFRQMLDGTTVIVNERTASKTVTRGAVVAARINHLGPSGGPEMDGGCLPFSTPMAAAVLRQLTAWHDDFRRDHPRAGKAAFYELTPPFLTHAWLAGFFDPVVPDVVNADGEHVLPTFVTFEVAGDRAAIAAALTEHEDFEALESGGWNWMPEDTRGRRVPAGNVELRDDELRLEAFTAEGGERGHAFLDALVPDLLRHQHTVHRSLQQMIRDERRDGDASESSPDELDHRLREALVLDHLERHYRSWLDESIPALDGVTPREAVEDARLRTKVAELIRGLEGDYERDLRVGEPAYDPSWMWAELGLVDDEPDAPQLATDRWAREFEWSEECAAIADHVRERDGFDERATRLRTRDVRDDLSARRLLAELDGDQTTLEIAFVAALNQELHRRRTFWVSESLAYMLQKTDTEVVGRDLGLPFPSFALAFTDRATLSIGERLLAATDSPMSGYILRVLTVFVRGRADTTEGERTVELDFAFDTLGEGTPHVVSHSLVVREDAAIFDDPSDPLLVEIDETELRIDRTEPLDRLVRLVVNTTLYATSAGVEPEPRTAFQNPRRVPKNDPADSDSLYYLPGKISISHLRNVQAVERGDSGGQLMHRFMVRGHWRRANPSWKDQRMRWIEPYWKGPDLAAIIERQYQLED